MGNPAVVFTTYSINSSTSWATTNVSGHAANSTSSPFVELKSDLIPHSAKFSNGDYSVSDFDTIRTIKTENTINNDSSSESYGDIIGTHEDTFYSSKFPWAVQVFSPGSRRGGAFGSRSDAKEDR